MKHIYLTLLGAMFMTTAFAQQVDESGMVLDSMIVTDADGVRNSLEAYEYNSDKKVTVISYYSYYANPAGQLASREVTTYDAQGRMVKDEEYSYTNGVPMLIYLTDYADYDSEGRPTTAISQEVDDENPAAGLQLSEKTVIKGYYGNTMGMVDADFYIYEEGQWEKQGSVHCDYNNDGTMSKMTYSIIFLGFPFNMVTTYEYDSHKNTTKEVTTSDFSDPSTVTYENEYADGLLKKSKATETTEYGSTVSYNYYFWGTGNSANLTPATLAKKISRYYDLGGRVYEGTPNGKGLFILNGKKVLKK